MTSEIEDASTTRLPKDWEMRIDSRTGMPYYLNHAKQFTTWDDPRQVDHPRGMLNPMGSMLRRSASPTPAAAAQRRMPIDHGFTSIPFNHFFEPAEENSRGLRARPRQQGYHNTPFEPRMNSGSWFSGFDEPDDSFFTNPIWPLRSRSGSLRQQSPFESLITDKSSTLPRGRSRQGGPGKYSVTIPINSETGKFSPQQPESDAVQEEAIIPQEKTAAPKADDESAVSGSRRDSPQPKQAKQDESKGDANGKDHEKTTLSRVESQYDNHDSQLDECDCDTVPESQNNSECDCETSQHEEPQTEDKMADDAPTTAVDENSKTGANDLNTACKSDGEMDESVPEADDNSNTINLIDQSYEAIEKVKSEVDEYKQQVQSFSGSKASKDYRYLDEMLTRCQLTLDDVSTHGDVELRKKRKETVNFIESVLALLESKCKE